MVPKLDVVQGAAPEPMFHVHSTADVFAAALRNGMVWDGPRNHPAYLADVNEKIYDAALASATPITVRSRQWRLYKEVHKKKSTHRVLFVPDAPVRVHSRVLCEPEPYADCMFHLTVGKA